MDDLRLVWPLNLGIIAALQYLGQQSLSSLEKKGGFWKNEYNVHVHCKSKQVIHQYKDEFIFEKKNDKVPVIHIIRDRDIYIEREIK